MQVSQPFDLTESIRTNCDMLRNTAQTRYDAQRAILNDHLAQHLHLQRRIWSLLEQLRKQSHSITLNSTLHGQHAPDTPTASTVISLDLDDTIIASSHLGPTLPPVSSSPNQHTPSLNTDIDTATPEQLKTLLSNTSSHINLLRQRLRDTRLAYQCQLQRLDHLEQSLCEISNDFEQKEMLDTDSSHATHHTTPAWPWQRKRKRSLDYLDQIQLLQQEKRQKIASSSAVFNTAAVAATCIAAVAWLDANVGIASIMSRFFGV